MQNEINKRFSGAVWFKTAQETDVYIAGVGSVGSWLAMALSRMVSYMYLVDMDIVEKGNLAGQFYKTEDAEKDLYKVVALEDTLSKYSPEIGLSLSRQPIEETSTNWITPSTFACIDSMKSRKWLVEQWYTIHKDNSRAIFVDCRLGFDYYQIYCVTPATYYRYQATLFDDNALPDTPCTLKNNTYISMMAASHMAGLFVNHLSNIASKKEVCVVPFFKEVNVSFNMELNETTDHSL